MLAWLRSQAALQGTPYTTEQQQQYDRQVEYMESIANQLGPVKHKAKADKQQLQAEGKWLDAIEVVHFVEQLRGRAVAQLLALPGQVQALVAGTSSKAAVGAARALHDALLAAFNFGYMPPIRPSCIITIQHPAMVGVAASTCKGAGCIISGCLGNRLERQGAGYRLVLPHHKNARRWERGQRLRGAEEELRPGGGLTLVSHCAHAGGATRSSPSPSRPTSPLWWTWGSSTRGACCERAPPCPPSSSTGRARP